MVHKLVADIGFTPKILLADFDMKLIGGEFKKLLTKLKTIAKSPPPQKQK